jgi:SPP1 gp7 family putative phage head morphogenesis protein
MATANQKLYEAALRHQVHLLRFSEGQADSVLRLLAETELDLLERITGAFAAGKDASRLESILASVLKRRAQVYQAIGKELTEQLKGLAEAEAAWEAAALTGSVPIKLNLASVPLESVLAAAGTPINGVPLEGWLNNIGSSEATRLQQVVSLAIVQGQTIDQLASAIRGTAKANFEDGILAVSRRNAQALARTAVSHVSNQARESVWNANKDIVRALRWTSTLDGRTSSICQARDGHLTPVGDSILPPSEQPLSPAGARPPAHFQCRSVMVAVLDGVAIAGDRPFVADERTRAKRESAFREEAKKRGVPIQQVRKEWADKNVGQVPSSTSYSEWMKGQPKAFQDEVLGKARADLFRSGLPLERFVDASGRKLTLEQLRAELAGDALNVLQPAVGLKAKGLLMAGAAPEDIIKALKAEFPDAKTSLASLATYKSELKKAGLLPDPGQSMNLIQMQNVPGYSTAYAMEALEKTLPKGITSAIGGKWGQVVGDLQGHPGAYAHYKPGIGVQLSDAKIKTLSPLQAQQVMAHELSHLLHKEHDLVLGAEDMQAMWAKAKAMPPELKKLYGYYLAHPDELWAEVLGQALKPGPLTSQGIDAKAFKSFFAAYIEEAQIVAKAKFPDAPPYMPGAPGGVIPGMGEMAGKPTSIGAFAKALLKQGMSDDLVLAAVKAEFPEAKTGINSIKSYKSELKKAEALAIGKPGPVVHAVVDAEVPAPSVVAPPPAAPVLADYAKMSVVDLVDKLLAGPGLVGLGPMKITGSITASKAIKKAAAVLFKAGLKTETVEQALALKFKGTPAAPYVPKKNSLASLKSALKKDGLFLDSNPLEPLKATDLGYTQMLPEPKLWGKPLGPFATQAVAKAESIIFQGGNWDEVEGALKLMQFGTGAWNPEGGKDLFDLAWYKVKTGKAVKPGVTAAHKQAFSYEAPKPLRLATTPREGQPPPPRFSETDRNGAIRVMTQESGMDTRGLAPLNAKQSAAGLEQLTAEEYSAIRMYTGGHYGNLNRRLRGGEFANNPHLQAYVDAALHGLRKMPKHVGWVNRGMSIYGDDIAKLRARYVPGAIVEEHAFISTSTASGFSGNVRLRILSKTGVDVAPYSRHSSEMEVLLGPGTRLRVTSVEGTGDRMTITMEEV